MSAEIEIRPTTYAEWYALEEERDQLRAELARLRSAPVAVEMPELTKQQIAMAEACCDEDDYPPFEEWALNGKLGDLADIVATLYKARSNAVDPSRILKDGERAVPTDRIEVLERIATIVAIATGEGSSRARHWPELAHLVVQLEDMRALRSQRAAEVVRHDWISDAQHEAGIP